jgi:hypothetical protein
MAPASPRKALRKLLRKALRTQAGLCFLPTAGNRVRGCRGSALFARSLHSFMRSVLRKQLSSAGLRCTMRRTSGTDLRIKR